MIKLVVFDLDGTIAKVGKPVEEQDLKIIKAIFKKDVKLAICSGKTTYYLCGFARQMGISDLILIGENGATIQFGIDLPPKNFYNLTFTSEAKQSLRTINDDLQKMFSGKIWFQPNEICVTPFPTTECEFALIDEYIKTHPNLFKEISVYKHIDSYDFVPSTFSKYEGLKKLSEITSIKKEEIIAVGDGNNDIPMFKFAKHAIGININENVDISFNNITDALLYIYKYITGENYDSSL